jgi:hypothetical protein
MQMTFHHRRLRDHLTAVARLITRIAAIPPAPANWWPCRMMLCCCTSLSLVARLQARARTPQELRMFISRRHRRRPAPAPGSGSRQCR